MSERSRCGAAALVPLALALCLPAGLAASAEAETCGGGTLWVRFVESAPRDRFELEASDAFAGSVSGLVIDLAGSAGALVFDTEPGGEGLEVFQPFRSEGASAGVEATVGAFAGDGATRIDIALKGLGASGRYAFSIDVDDTLVASELGRIRVAGAEIGGATVAVRLDGAADPVVAAFDADATATLCP